MARVTEKKRIKIDHSCVAQPVYLNWLNLAGGRDYWLFKLRQAYNLTTELKGVFEPYTPDIENAQGTIFETGRNAKPRLVLGASSVLLEDVQGIEGLLYSPNVLMLMNPTTWQVEGVRWQIVRPVPGSFNLYNTDAIRTSVELAIDLEPINVQGT